MCLHGSSCHLELTGDFSVVTALKQQVDDLLFARPQTNHFLLHTFPHHDFAARTLGDRSPAG